MIERVQTKEKKSKKAEYHFDSDFSDFLSDIGLDAENGDLLIIAETAEGRRKCKCHFCRSEDGVTIEISKKGEIGNLIKKTIKRG